ncbi:MAG: hypothetical protein OJF55_000218 [Rhodanobacteraceae bacterium]|nr:MAG: hypothetical protein OJF55_000218 [Rhodanobacteraceae bacterium]
MTGSRIACAHAPRKRRERLRRGSITRIARRCQTHQFRMTLV